MRVLGFLLILLAAVLLYFTLMKKYSFSQSVNAIRTFFNATPSTPKGANQG